MADDDGLHASATRSPETRAECAAARAHEDALRAEISVLRGVVAALRGARAKPPPPRERELPWRAAAIGFAVGVSVTLALLVAYRVGICP